MLKKYFYSNCALLLLVLALICPQVKAEDDSLNKLTEAEIADGWIQLFDGKTFFGWRKAAQADWQILDGSIIVSSGEVGLLRTTTQFADYHLKVDFKAAADTNSGIFLRTSPRPKSPAYDCYELNIAPENNSFPTGSFVGRKKVTVVNETNSWHTFDVVANQGMFEIKLDGKLVLKYEDKSPLGTGFIGLQHNQGKVEFRNIKLKPLNLKSIFNGKDLSSWKEYPEMASKFSVTDEGYLNVKDGRGQLETTDVYGNFVLQLEAITHAKNLNSGIFFRCIPGDVMMGYESQIHNGYEAGDRTKPIDSGTGAIFRRTQARLVVPDDQKWFSKTLIAEGGHFSVWVNGYQVTDWTDTRKPDPNPRKGLRLEPGTIMIQGHDPTTDLSFRNITITETPGRWPKK